MRNYLTLIIFSVLIGIPGKSFTQSSVKGIVFEDANKNNRKERNEKGVPDVAVLSPMGLK